MKEGYIILDKLKCLSIIGLGINKCLKLVFALYQKHNWILLRCIGNSLELYC